MDPEVNEETNEETLTLEGLQEILKTEREANSAEFAKHIETLRTPDRSTVEELGIGNTPHQIGESGDTRTSAEITRGESVSIISRHQPIDDYYRGLSPAMQEWRTPDTDHWGAEWIRGQHHKDHGRMAEAVDKSEEWVGRAFGRAVTLEGAGSLVGAVGGGVGGEFIPRPVEQAILIARNMVSKMRGFASSFVMTRQVHQIPTAAAMTGAMVAEGSTGSNDEPDIAQVALIAQKGQVVATASLEMLDDSAVNLVGLYTQLAGEGLGTLEDDQFWSTGNGTPPNITSKVDGTAYLETTTLALGFVDVATMYFNVGQPYRDNAAWYGAANVLQMLSTVVDSAAGRQLYAGFGDGPGAIVDDSGAVATLMRRPVFEVPLLDGTLIFGDMRAGYIVGTRAGITARSSTDVLFASDKIMWSWTSRFDGNDRDVAALQRVAGITSATAAAA